MSAKTSSKSIVWIICGAVVAIIGIVIGVIIALNAGNSDNTEDSSSAAANGAALKELTVVESGWSYVQHTLLGNAVWYGVAIKNENAGKVASFPVVKVVGRSLDDKILFTDEFSCSLDYAYYNEVLYCGGHYGDQTEKPAKVEFKASLNEWEDEAAVNYPRNTDFVIKNVSEKKDGDTTTFAGEIFNKSRANINSAHVVAIFRKKGKIVGGDMSYSDKLSANSSDVFSMYVLSGPDYDQYEITASVAMIN